MTRLVGFVEELVHEVGPRPAASEGEHRAAEFIAQRFEGLELDTTIQEFSCARGVGWVRAVYYLLGAAAAFLLFLQPNLSFVSLALVIISVILLILDLIDKNPLFNLFNRGLSQNVIARHVPSEALNHRRSKVVIIAHYDSGRSTVQTAPLFAKNYTLMRNLICLCIIMLLVVIALYFAPLPVLVKQVLNVIGVILGALSLIALIFEVINLFMPFNQGANSNGSGVAALFGTAERLVGGTAMRTRGESSAQEAQESNGGFDAARYAQAIPVNESSRRRGGAGNVFAREPHTREPQVEERDQIDSSDEPLRRERISRREATLREEREGAKGSLGAVAEERSLAQGRQSEERDTLLKPQPYSGRQDKTSSPVVRRRPALEREEQERQAQYELEQRQIAEAKAAEEEATAVPAWFASAKKKAAEKERHQGMHERSQPAQRSQFADIPLGANAASLVQDFAEKPSERERAERVERVESAQAAQSEVHERAEHAEHTGADHKDHNEEQNSFLKQVGEKGTSVTARERAFDPEHDAVSRDLKDQKTKPASDDTGKFPAQTSAPQPAVKPAISADMRGLDTTAFEVIEDRDAGSVVVPATDLQDRQQGFSEAASSEEASEVAERISPDILQSIKTSVPTENRRNLSIPSILPGDSGAIPVQQASIDDERKELFQAKDSPVSLTGSFAALGATGTMKPVGEELLAYHNAGDSIYINDADDSHTDFALDAQESYAPQLQYAEIPESRARSFFGGRGSRSLGRGKRKKSQEFEESPASWIGVDEDFNARQEGGNIGSWDKFSEDDTDNWKGGAHGGASFEENVRSITSFSSELLDKEVWFVAVGAHEAKNAGIKMLLREYSSELRNALLINVDSVGAGDLCFTLAEGTFRKVHTDHRLQNLIQSTAQSLGTPIAPVTFTGYATDATEALSEGARAISIIGLGKQLPIGWRWSDDHVDVLSEEAIQETVELVVEVIKGS